MFLNKENFELFAAKHYTNGVCQSKDEFYEDLERYKLARKLARKVANGRSVNIRLLCNHVLCFTNNFEIDAAKQMLMFDADIKEQRILKTVLNYFGFIRRKEYPEIKIDLETVILLKEMD